MNYIYTPNDIAIFLLKANFTLSDEQMVLNDLWKEYKHIDIKYIQDKSAFIRRVHLEMISYTFKADMDELDLIMRDIEPEYILSNPSYEQDYILQFFKIIRLELLYIKGKNYHKIKLRKLLKYFGYKRRSNSLIQNIRQAMTVLSLTPYLRGHVSCDIKNVALDDMIMIRLK